jgi:mannose-6-phosphate isomerase class I
LHVEKALDVIRFGKQSGGKIDPVTVARGPVTETFFISCRYFATEKWEFAEPIAAASSREHFDLMIILEGSGTFESHDSRPEYAPAQVWMIPAALGAYQIEPSSRTTLLRTYVPSGPDEFLQRLKNSRVEESKWSRLVHR